MGTPSKYSPERGELKRRQIAFISPPIRGRIKRGGETDSGVIR